MSTTRLYAFWEYDQFPFVLSGEAIGKTQSDGYIRVRGYDGMRFKPLRVIAGNRGRELSEQLSQLKEDFRAEQRKVGQQFKAKALKIAPFLKDCERSSFYRSEPSSERRVRP